MSNLHPLMHASSQYIESLYLAYKKNPNQIDNSWKSIFDKKTSTSDAKISSTYTPTTKEINVYRLIEHYRNFGHRQAHIDPLYPPKNDSSFSLSHFDLHQKDLKSTFQAIKPLHTINLAHAIDKLKKIYCDSIGFEYSHIQDENIKYWLQKNIENNFFTFQIDPQIQKHIIQQLLSAQLFENFLQKKYLGQKRFSLEGATSALIAIDTLIQEGIQNNTQAIMIGMAHRGRLNILANILHKPYQEIFGAFEGKNITKYGDVKYHLGHIYQKKTAKQALCNIHLLPNPSHLEFVNAIVQGYTRATQEKKNISTKNIIPLIVHGDTALAGQGIAYELIQMSQLPAYNIGGTIHLVINNQIGFTTEVESARTSKYCTDIAKVIDAPVLHVNGDDPEAVYCAIKFAYAYRQNFSKDIFIDMVCYRKYGHNESDEPRFTQPQLYTTIQHHKDVLQKYTEKLLHKNIITHHFIQQYTADYNQKLQNAINTLKNSHDICHKIQPATKQLAEKKIETNIKIKTLNLVIEKLTTLPTNFTPLKQIIKLIEKRKNLFFQKKKIDWATAELLAYATLLLENFPIRLVGQDVERGTFSHRHAVLKDIKTNISYNILNHLHKEQAYFTIENSLLSENAALGFEFGYTMAHAQALTIWEAQFGDFVNGAQVIIDQFICSAQAKWSINSGLVMLLPHGYEGQGPEHSSARLERFLQLCAQHNLQIANLTTPANFFHILRKQHMCTKKVPLVIMSPKSLLRHPKVVSTIEDFTSKYFEPIIDDTIVEKDKVKKILLCTGKIYYELFSRREDENIQDVAIIRIEQLYPFPQKTFEHILNKYPKKIIYKWVQEEPKNMGACMYIKEILSAYNVQYITREASATPATGHLAIHYQEQKDIIEKAFHI